MDPIVLIPLTAIFVVGLFLGRNELRKRKLSCPRKREMADVDVIQRYDRPDKPVRVKSCDLLDDPNTVDCEEECLSQNG